MASWFLLAIAAGLVWRIVRFGLHFEITGDESGILCSVIERSYRGLLDPLSYANVSPPLFLWMTKFLEAAFQSDWAARLVPFLAGLGAAALFGLICLEALKGKGKWVAWAIFCVAYVPINEGTRVKGYTIDLLVAVVMQWLMLRWLLSGRQARYLAALAFCAPVFVWLSYTSVFIIGTAGLILAVCVVKPSAARMDAGAKTGGLGRQNLFAAAAFMALTALSAALLYKLNIRPALHASTGNGLAEGWKQGFPPDQIWKFPWWLLYAQTGRGFAWPVGDTHFGSVLTWALWLTGLIVYWRAGNRWVWFLFVAPQALLLAAALVHKYPYLQNPRLCMFLGPGICLFAGRGAEYWIDLAGTERRRWWYRGVAAVLLVFALGGIGRDIKLRVREAKAPGMRSALAEASRIAGPDGQFVMLNDPNDSVVFKYYIQRTVKQKVWPGGQVPAQSGPGRKLALVAVTSRISDIEGDSLFAQFEKRYPGTIKVEWSQTARNVLDNNKDGIVVWVCEAEEAKPPGKG